MLNGHHVSVGGVFEGEVYSAPFPHNNRILYGIIEYIVFENNEVTKIGILLKDNNWKTHEFKANEICYKSYLV
jgi:hypothetical protein